MARHRSLLIPFVLFLTLFEASDAFAAKKKKGVGRKQKRASTSKGFGAAPPTLDEVLDAFPTRIPEDADSRACPCGVEKTYGECCKPFHAGASCPTMTDVLRSRFTAFSWRVIKNVMETTHPTNRDFREDGVAWAKDLNKQGMFDSFEFVKLEAGTEEPSADDENEGYIDFKVTMRAKADSATGLAGQETVISERSRFLRESSDGGGWKYASGDVRSEVAGLEDTQLNS